MKSLSSLVEMSESCFFLFLQRSNNNTSNVFSSLTLSEIQAWSESFERLMASLGESIISEHLYTCPSSLNTSEHLNTCPSFLNTSEHLNTCPSSLNTSEHLNTCQSSLNTSEHFWPLLNTCPSNLNTWAFFIAKQTDDPHTGSSWYMRYLKNGDFILEVQSFQEVAEYFESSYGVNTVRRTFSFGWPVRTWRRRRALRRWRRRHGWSTKTTFQFCRPERWAAVLQKLLQLHGTVEENWVRSFGNDKLSETSSRLSNVHAKITIINIFLWMPLSKQCLSNAVKINIKNDNHFSIKY